MALPLFSRATVPVGCGALICSEPYLAATLGLVGACAANLEAETFPLEADSLVPDRALAVTVAVAVPTEVWTSVEVGTSVPMAEEDSSTRPSGSGGWFGSWLSPPAMQVTPLPPPTHPTA